MIKYSKPIAFLAFLLAGSANVIAVEQSSLFSVAQLQNNEVLEITYASQGCFHSDRDKFTFTSDSVSSNVMQSVSLSAEELVKIDNYLNRLLTKKSTRRCTTVTDLSLTLRRNGEVVQNRNLVDGECFLSPDEMNFGYLKYHYAKSDLPQETSDK